MQRSQVAIIVIALVCLVIVVTAMAFWLSMPEPGITVQAGVQNGRAAVTVNGTRFPANREVYVGLSEPGALPMAGTSFASTFSGPDGKFSVTFLFPVDPVWTKLTDVMVYAGTPDGGAVATARLALSSLAQWLTPLPVATPTPSSLTTPQRGPTAVIPTVVALPTATPTVPASATPVPTAVPIPLISLQPTSARIGTAVAVAGRGWRPNQTLTLSLAGYGTQSKVDVGTAGTDANGNFAVSFVFPNTWAGPASVIVSARNADGTQQAIALFEAIGAITPTMTAPTPFVITDWLGEYYANQSLDGNPALLHNDLHVDFDWGLNAPAAGLPVDHFSIRWTRQVNFLPASYRFFARADDGVRVWLDGNRIIDEWHRALDTQYTADVANLSEGLHTIKVEYYDETSNAKVRVWWQVLPPTPTSTPTFTPTATSTVTGTGVVTGTTVK